MTDFSPIRVTRRWLAAMGCALALAGCGGAPLPVLTSGPDPADPRAAARAAPYTPVTSGTVNHQPVEPKAWRDMNERVAPGAGRTP